MVGILRAYGRALRSLFVARIMRHFVWPILVSAALWMGIGVLFWDRLARWLTTLFATWKILGAQGGAGEKAVATSLPIALYLLSLPLMFVTAVLLLELLALPLILDKVARLEYVELEQRHGGSQWQSIRRTLLSFVVAAGVLVLGLPLWLVPGAGALLLFAASAWLNYRSFSYDVLMRHADADELVALPARHRGWLLLLALGAGSLTLVPVVNLLAVPFCGLAFTHYLLDALQAARSSARASNSGSRS